MTEYIRSSVVIPPQRSLYISGTPQLSEEGGNEHPNFSSENVSPNTENLQIAGYKTKYLISNIIKLNY
ncbi:hypothetical protein NQ317_008005 [Molorchus minor]|uniref:Uncharacterized protein n=1 Tax=Molorchus minor TaxID=1323400 RepID=A0ABQ9J8D7_9CUCU|nr:hypothetical protein NQ317_008005 [Molorchus minor]